MILTMIVRLKEGPIISSDLKGGHNYFMIGIEADDDRILNDHGKPSLYASNMFDGIDSHEPNDWVTETGEEGERYAYPPSLNRVGFFEDFFEGDSETISE